MTKDILLNKLGRHIAVIREKSALSQAELARSCDKDPQSLNRLEKGRVNPGIFYLYQFARELNIPLKKMVDFE